MFITQLLIIAFVPHILPFQSFRCMSMDKLNSAWLTFLIHKIEKNRKSTVNIWGAVGSKWSWVNMCCWHGQRHVKDPITSASKEWQSFPLVEHTSWLYDIQESRRNLVGTVYSSTRCYVSFWRKKRHQWSYLAANPGKMHQLIQLL